MGSVPQVAEAKDVRLVGYHDLNQRPGFKMAAQEVAGRWYLYLAHLWHSGWSVLDVTNPEAPELLCFVPGPENTWTLQVQVADSLMLVALERPEPGWGFDLSLPSSTGIQLFDVKEPANPQPQGIFTVDGRGTHRNHYAGGSLAYLAANPAGYHGNILIILDVSDPNNPREVSRWSLPEQSAKQNPEPLHQYYLHGPAYADGKVAYLSYGKAGLIILDISDPTNPLQLGQLNFPGFGSVLGVHSTIPVPGTSLLVVNSEAIREEADEPHNYAFLVDVTDPTTPYVIGAFPTPQPAPETGLDSYVCKGGRFGPHNQHHPQGSHLYSSKQYIALTWFNAGLRIFDIAQPHDPREVACFVPQAPKERIGALPSELQTQFEDVLIDARGVIYCTDKNHGLFILRSSFIDASLQHV
ncbi:MAG: hypothetical protein FWG47_07870 [Propionibacteriaceae bacterium]|nr:hypothetical protein [Propionibacteriaceae bacterium]